MCVHRNCEFIVEAQKGGGKEVFTDDQKLVLILNVRRRKRRVRVSTSSAHTQTRTRTRAIVEDRQTL